MVPTELPDYWPRMPSVADILAANLRQIRVETSGTQERFCEFTGISQAHLSDLENAKGWKQMKKVSARLEAVGIDPGRLLARPPENPEIAELVELYGAADELTRGAILTILRAAAARARTISP